MKIFINGFWGEPHDLSGGRKSACRTLLIAPVIISHFIYFMGVGSEVIFPYISLAAETLLNPTSILMPC